MKALHGVAFILVIVGGLNWGLVGLGYFIGQDLNIVHLILGSMMSLESLVYALVGVSAIVLVVDHKSTCRTCCSPGM